MPRKHRKDVIFLNMEFTVHLNVEFGNHMALTSQLLSVILNMVCVAINASLTATHNRKALLVINLDLWCFEQLCIAQVDVCNAQLLKTPKNLNYFPGIWPLHNNKINSISI